MPDAESKLYASTQVVDEARHMEAFSRYLRENIPDYYPVSKPLALLMNNLLTDSRWDITALGMQILIEALAMAAFRTANATFNDPLIKQITSMVARDEARHVSFGVLSLEHFYPELTEAERREREEFTLEAASLMRRRFLLEEVWDRLGVPRATGIEFAATSPIMVTYRRTIFAKVVSSLARIGLMSDRVLTGMDKLGLVSRSALRQLEDR
jgi:rubrerythrin